MSIPILDLTRLAADIQAEIEAATLRVLRSGVFILGPEVTEFECEMADYLGVKDVVGLSSGTDALLAALMALGIQRGDKVALPTYSFFATAGVVERLGAVPVFVDIRAGDCNIDPQLLESALQQNDVKAVIAVHLYGAGVDVSAVQKICDAHGVPWIEDAAQAIGTRIDGKLAGGLGRAGCFSTFPTKNLGGTGDGGFLSTDDEEFGKTIRLLRNHGMSTQYRHEIVGGNFRIDALQAAALRVKLRHIETFTEARRANAARYRAQFAKAGITNDAVRLPTDVDRHAYHQFVMHVQNGKRDAVLQTLRDRKIGAGVYYPIPFHMQPCFAHLGQGEGSFPVAERASRETLALPIYPELREDEIDLVVASIADALS